MPDDENTNQNFALNWFRSAPADSPQGEQILGMIRGQLSNSDTIEEEELLNKLIQLAIFLEQPDGN